MTTKVEADILRQRMVEEQIAARGVHAPQVLDAMRRVQREGYIPSYLGEFAYDDTPLPIEEEQTISQPFIVAFMTAALHLEGGDRVLEIGTGSGYAAAILAEIAAEVFTIERHRSLARTAAERLERDGYRNVRVRHGDGTLGWPEAAPFDAIIVAAGGPEVPPSLREQLAIDGRLVIPVGSTVGLQQLIRVTRTGPDTYQEEALGDVRFVPLVGEQGWHEPAPDEEAVQTTAMSPTAALATPTLALPTRIAQAGEPFGAIEEANLSPLLERIGDARVVLLGEASHGTSEFYRMRARITRELVTQKDFGIVAVEADWPDAARVDHYVRDRDVPAAEWQAFARFPTWMWRNVEVQTFVEWLRAHNLARPHNQRVRFSGLDLYGLFNSIAAVLQYLDQVDPETALVARERYGCLTPWQRDPAAYGRAALTGAYRSCEREAVVMLKDLFDRRMAGVAQDDERYFDSIQNARLIASAEAYYRIMYYGSHESWNLRDRHMFDTLQAMLKFAGPNSKAVVWAHNSHIGNANATEMSARGEFNIGQLCRQHFGDQSYSIGFGTDHGEVACASHWDGPMAIKQVSPSREGSYEGLCHDTTVPRFMLDLRPEGDGLRRDLSEPRLERAIGVIYRPETELASHYFHAILPEQFDEYIWFDRTRAVEPLATGTLDGLPETYPFGL